MGPLIPVIILLTFFAIIILYDLFVLIKGEMKITRQKLLRLFDLLIITTSISFIFFAALWEVNFLDYKTSIPYSKWKEIKYSDFKRYKNPFKNDYFSADVFCKVNVKAKKDGFVIDSRFYPSRSYVYNDKIIDKYLLTHEIYHFHITECSARMMRKELTSLIKNRKPINIYDLQNYYLFIEDSLQDLYDTETTHGLRLSKQIYWQEKVDSMLLSLDQYVSTEIYLKN